MRDNKILNKINSLSFGEFTTIESGKSYENYKYTCKVFTTESFTKELNETLLQEVSYLDNELLKKHLNRKKFINDNIINEYKELSKYDHTMLTDSIENIDDFLVSVVGVLQSKYETDSVMELVYPDSVKYTISEEEFIIIYEK